MIKREHSAAVEPNHTEQSRRMGAVGSGVRAARCALLTAFLALGSGLVGGCSDSLECAGSIPEGAVYKVTILTETATSDKCYVVHAQRMSPFEVTGGKTQRTAARSDCSITPAKSALPAELDLTIDNASCVPNESGMLGMYCGITYKEGCSGNILSYFEAPAGATVNWGAPVIDNVLFRIQDFSPNCFSSQSNCLDEYTARLERIQ